MYSAIISSVMFPVETAKYPRAHKCLPQNSFRNRSLFMSNFLDVTPFSFCTNLETHSCGGTDTNMCTWSLLIFPAKISTSNSAHTFRITSRTCCASSPYNTGFLYLVIHTKWYFRSNRQCEPFRYSCIPFLY